MDTLKRVWKDLEKNWNWLRERDLHRPLFLTVTILCLFLALEFEKFILLIPAVAVWVPTVVKSGAERSFVRRVFEVLMDLMVAATFGLIFALLQDIEAGAINWPADIPPEAVMASVVILMVETVSSVVKEFDKIEEARVALEEYQEILKSSHQKVSEARYAELAAEALRLDKQLFSNRPKEAEDLVEGGLEATRSLRAWMRRAGLLRSGGNKGEDYSGWLGLMRVYQREEMYDASRQELTTNVRNYAFGLLAIIRHYYERLGENQKLVVAHTSGFSPKDFYNFPNGDQSSRHYHEAEFFGNYRRVLSAVTRSEDVEPFRVVLASDAWIADQERGESDASSPFPENNQELNWPADSIDKLAFDCARYRFVPVPITVAGDRQASSLVDSPRYQREETWYHVSVESEEELKYLVGETEEDTVELPEYTEGIRSLGAVAIEAELLTSKEIIRSLEAPDLQGEDFIPAIRLPSFNKQHNPRRELPSERVLYCPAEVLMSGSLDRIVKSVSEAEEGLNNDRPETWGVQKVWQTGKGVRGYLRLLMRNCHYIEPGSDVGDLMGKVARSRVEIRESAPCIDSDPWDGLYGGGIIRDKLCERWPRYAGTESYDSLYRRMIAAWVKLLAAIVDVGIEEVSEIDDASVGDGIKSLEDYAKGKGEVEVEELPYLGITEEEKQVDQDYEKLCMRLRDVAAVDACIRRQFGEDIRAGQPSKPLKGIGGAMLWLMELTQEIDARLEFIDRGDCIQRKGYCKKSSMGVDLGVAEEWLHRALAYYEASDVGYVGNGESAIAQMEQGFALLPLMMRDLLGVSAGGEMSTQHGVPEIGDASSLDDGGKVRELLFRKLHVSNLDTKAYPDFMPDDVRKAQTVAEQMENHDILPEFMMVGIYEENETDDDEPVLDDNEIVWKCLVGTEISQPFHTCRIRFWDNSRGQKSKGNDDMFTKHVDWIRSVVRHREASEHFVDLVEKQFEALKE